MLEDYGVIHGVYNDNIMRTNQTADSSASSKDHQEVSFFDIGGSRLNDNVSAIVKSAAVRHKRTSSDSGEIQKPKQQATGTASRIRLSKQTKQVAFGTTFMAPNEFVFDSGLNEIFSTERLRLQKKPQQQFAPFNHIAGWLTRNPNANAKQFCNALPRLAGKDLSISPAFVTSLSKYLGQHKLSLGSFLNSLGSLALLEQAMLASGHGEDFLGFKANFVTVAENCFSLPVRACMRKHKAFPKNSTLAVEFDKHLAIRNIPFAEIEVRTPEAAERFITEKGRCMNQPWNSTNPPLVAALRQLREFVHPYPELEQFIDKAIDNSTIKDKSAMKRRCSPLVEYALQHNISYDTIVTDLKLPADEQKLMPEILKVVSINLDVRRALSNYAKKLH